MDMKKMISLALASVTALSLMACSPQGGSTPSEPASAPESSLSSQDASEPQGRDAKETVTITSLNGSRELMELEVPYDPPAHRGPGHGRSGHPGGPGGPGSRHR